VDQKSVDLFSTCGRFFRGRFFRGPSYRRPLSYIVSAEIKQVLLQDHTGNSIKPLTSHAEDLGDQKALSLQYAYTP